MILFDVQAFRAINDAVGSSPVLDAVGRASGTWLIYAMGAALAGRAAYAWHRRHRHGKKGDLCVEPAALLIRAVAAAICAFLTKEVFGLLWFRPRPFVTLHAVHQLAAETATSTSFPSGHSSFAFALAFSVLFDEPVFGGILLVVASFVAWGRVYVGVHYPLDVIAGVFVGLFWAFVVRKVARRVNDEKLLGRLKFGHAKDRV